jgi:hypothetical protein
MGQERTGRTKYRRLVKRRLVPVAVHAPMPEPGTLVLHAAAEVVTMHSGRQRHGAGGTRLDAHDTPLACGEPRMTARCRPECGCPKGSDEQEVCVTEARTVVVNRDEPETAFLFVSSGTPLEHSASISVAAGQIRWHTGRLTRWPV